MGLLAGLHQLTSNAGKKKKKTTFCAEYSACVYCCYSQTQILVTGNITNMSEEATVPLEVLKACVARFRVSISKD